MTAIKQSLTRYPFRPLLCLLQSIQPTPDHDALHDAVSGRHIKLVGRAWHKIQFTTQSPEDTLSWSPA